MGSHLGPGLGPHLVVYPHTNAFCASFLQSDGSNLRIPRVLPVTAAGEAIAACGRRGQGRRSRRSGPLSPPAAGCYPSGRCGDGKGDPTHPLLNARRVEHLSIPELGRGSGGGAPRGVWGGAPACEPIPTAGTPSLERGTGAMSGQRPRTVPPQVARKRPARPPANSGSTRSTPSRPRRSHRTAPTIMFRGVACEQHRSSPMRVPTSPPGTHRSPPPYCLPPEPMGRGNWTFRLLPGPSRLTGSCWHS